MTTIASAGIDLKVPKLIAPLWHTALLLAIFAGLAISGALFQRQASVDPRMLQQHTNMVPLYLSLLAMEWALFLYVRKGVRLTGFSLRELVGGRWTSARGVMADFSLALAIWVLWSLIQLIWNHVSGPSHAASIQILLPQGAAEKVLWIAVSASAGICEELAFRGYFQRQFAALAHSRWIALFVQAALFGISHGYQGVEACARIAVFGLLFGLLALWRSSLRPGMVAHAWGDIASGIFGIDLFLLQHRDIRASSPKRRRLAWDFGVSDFSALYKQYAPDVHRFALYLSGQRADAEDITAETFARVWASSEPIVMATVKGYLFTIARHLFLHGLRKTSRHDALDEDLPDPHMGPAGQAEQDARLQSVLRELQSLPEASRSALLMHAVDGMAYEEIARVLGISLAAVKVKIHRARLALTGFRDA